MTTLFCFGVGFSALETARALKNEGWQISGTARSEEKCRRLEAEGFTMARFDGEGPGEAVTPLLEEATHILISAPPGDAGDPVLHHHGDDIAGSGSAKWLGYLSTVGVYGDHAGGWVDEMTPSAPVSARSKRRVAAELAWLRFAEKQDLPCGVFRLAGIYGPGRNAFVNLRRGKGRRLVKPGQVFNRIHVADIASCVAAAIKRPRADAIYNVTDDEPAPPQDVVAYAADLLGMEPPPEVAFADAELSEMARSFYGENKRVSNALIKKELGVTLNYPSYREGLKAILEEEAP